MFCSASDNGDIELRITEKMDFILVEVSVGMKQKEKAGKSSEAVEKSLRGDLSSAVIMYSQCHGTCTVKKKIFSCVTPSHPKQDSYSGSSMSWELHN